MTRAPVDVRRARALAILGDADRALDGWSCDCSTECCRFGVTGKEPWVTQVEWELVVAEVARQGRRLPVRADHDREGRCPFLAVDPHDDTKGRCTVYAARPLGCRTFFCERARGPDGEPAPYPKDDVKSLPRALDALTVTDPRADARARPLRSWLRTARLR